MTTQPLSYDNNIIPRKAFGVREILIISGVGEAKLALSREIGVRYLQGVRSTNTEGDKEGKLKLCEKKIKCKGRMGLFTTGVAQSNDVQP